MNACSGGIWRWRCPDTSVFTRGTRRSSSGGGRGRLSRFPLLRKHDAMPVECSQTELAHSPGLIGQWLDELSGLRAELGKQNIRARHPDVSKVGMIAQVTGRDG